jgi:hypothetical protein
VRESHLLSNVLLNGEDKGEEGAYYPVNFPNTMTHITTVSEALGPNAIDICMKAGMPATLISQLDQEGIYLEDTTLSLFKVEFSHVWENAQGFNAKLECWCNISPLGEVCSQTDAAMIPSKANPALLRAKTFTIGGLIHYAFEDLTDAEINAFRNASEVTENGFSIKEKANKASIFLVPENASSYIAFSLSTKEGTTKAGTPVTYLDVTRWFIDMSDWSFGGHGLGTSVAKSSLGERRTEEQKVKTLSIAEQMQALLNSSAPAVLPTIPPIVAPAPSFADI